MIGTKSALQRCTPAISPGGRSETITHCTRGGSRLPSAFQRKGISRRHAVPIGGESKQVAVPWSLEVDTAADTFLSTLTKFAELE
jgi:hypothetical protein